MPQIISTTVVSSFTEHTLHPNMNTLVPATMLNCSTVRNNVSYCTSSILINLPHLCNKSLVSILLYGLHFSCLSDTGKHVGNKVFTFARTMH